MKESIYSKYLDYLAGLICDRAHKYSSLLKELHSTAFYYSVELDGNRYEDGIDLRYRFGREYNIPEAVIASSLDTHPCSVLEMMTALALRCENEIMFDPDKGSRVSVWFWGMIKNLGLENMTDGNYSESFVKKRVHIFLERKHGRCGEGGLFTVKNCPCDMRQTEIWYQAMWYLNNYKED
ncbi:MAG: hypothetical protein NC078_08075 [Ruminococcus sp.]|nr:hypothetical protein [Ruminococcus sp.]